MVIPFLTVYLTHKGFSLETAGYVMAAFGGGSILGSYIGGRLTDKFGFFYVQFLSLLLNGILFIVLGQMRTIAEITICIFVLSSLGESFRPANAAAIAHYSSDENRIRCYSLNRLAVNLGWSIGPAIGGILASISYSWLFIVDGATCIIASLLLYKVLPPQKSILAKKETITENKMQSAYSDRLFLQGMFMVLLIGICFFQLFSIVPVYYKNVMHLNEATIGLLLAMNGILIVMVEMVLVYKLENRSNVFNYITMGTILIGCSFLFFNISSTLAIAIIAMLFITFGEMFLFPFMNNFWVKRSSPLNRGQYAAVYNISFSIGNVIAPGLAAQIASHAGFNTLWVIDFGICAIAAIGFILLKRKGID
jgi:predicted MFS family arabinose efflux permease